MSAILPNQLKISGPGERSYTANFGALHAVYRTPHVNGLGHIEHVQLHCDGGLFIRFTADEAAVWTRKLIVALATLPDFTGCSGALAFIPGGEL